MSVLRSRLSSVVLCLLAALPGVSIAQRADSPKQQRQQISVAEQYLFSAANAERVQRGLPPLQWDDALYLAASAHADAMAAHNTISHQFVGEPALSARGSKAGAHFNVISENVAMAPTAVEIHDMWMKSSHHRDNLLDKQVDHIAIRVTRRNGELYAVEDFERRVANLSLDDQEQSIAALVQQTGSIELLSSNVDARRTCAMTSGYSGSRKPWFVMRFTGGDLNRLPGELQQKLNSGRYHQASVGACRDNAAQDFTTYNIAVLLYP